jgi:hypothetical protein
LSLDVTMSVVKLLSRIVAPDIEYSEENVNSERKRNQLLAAKLHGKLMASSSSNSTLVPIAHSFSFCLIRRPHIRDYFRPSHTVCCGILGSDP